MPRSAPPRHLGRIVLYLLLVVCLPIGLASAQLQTPNDIRTDGRTGVAGAVDLDGLSSVVRADLHGSVRGPNLFFGFDHFNVGNNAFVNLTAGDTAVRVDNVIAMVSGTDVSDILGNVNVDASLGQDHFLFVNPNGVVFGENATVSTRGSFHVSSADEIVFENGQVLAAAGGPDSILSSAHPAAFGFLDDDAGQIRIAAERLELSRFATLSIVGGDVVLDGTLVQVLGGTIRIVAVDSAGTVEGIRDARADLDTTRFERLGRIEILNRSTVSASGFEPGPEPAPFNLRSIATGCGIDCFVRLLTVDLEDVDVAGRGDVVVALDEVNGRAAILRPIGRPGGTILVRGDSLRLENSDIRSRSFGQDRFGESGAIDVRLSGDLRLAKTDPNDPFNTEISARAESIELDYQNPRPGELPLANRIPSGGWTGGPLTPADGSFSLGANAAGGDVHIEAGSVTLEDGAVISTTTLSEVGSAGDIDLRIADRLLLAGVDPASPSDTPTSIFSNAEGGVTASGGTITIRGRDGLAPVPLLQLLDGGAIVAQTTGDGDAGDIDVYAGRIAIGHDSQIDSATSGTRILGGTGDAGALVIRADEEILLEGDLRPEFFAHLSTGSKPESAGSAGRITIQTPRLIARNGPAVSVVTEGSGAGGDLVLDVGELLLDNATITAASEGGADRSPGDAGQIEIGPAGGLYPNTFVRLHNGSAILTRAVAAGGGNILINAQLVEGTRDGEPVLELVKPGDGLPRRIVLRDSEISTSVATGTESGGNIAIDPSTLLLDASAITAQADAGSGGNILIATDFVIQSTDSLIDASAGPAGIDGNVVLEGTNVLVVEQSAESPAAYLRSDALLKERCAARDPSSGIGRLTLAGPKGVDLGSGGYLLSWPDVGPAPGRTAARSSSCPGRS